MTAPSKAEKDRAQLRQDVQALDAAELQDRMIHLRDQEREVQRELADRREQNAFVDADRRARDTAREIEDGARHVARAVALSVTSLLPPVVRQPSLIVDLTFNSAIAVLAFERDLINDLLGARSRPTA